MSDNRSILFWICSLVVASLTTGPGLHAEDAPSHKDTEVPIKVGNATTTIKVQESDPYKHLHVPAPTDKYDPRNYSMNQSSSMANKSFSASTDLMSKKSANLGRDQDSYATKSYGTNSANLRNGGNSKYTTSSSSDAIHGDSQFNKNYATPTSSMGSTTASSFNNASRDQDHTSNLSGQKSNTYGSGLSKQYLGPGAQHVPDGMVKENVVISHVSDIPNRPLTIDEVRSLINHGFKPDTTVAPDSPSRAINDPDYKPEASPEPPDMPTPRARPLDDDKDSPLPSPGTMSQPLPENSEPLPQH